MSDNIGTKSVNTVVAINHREVFDDILAVDLSKCAVTVCLASVSKTEARPTFERLKITEEITHEFRDVIENVLKPYKTDLKPEECLFPEFVMQSKPEAYEIEHMNLSAYNIIMEQINPLLSLASLDVFEENEQFVASLHFYVITLQPPNGEPVYFFRSYTQRKLLSRSQWFAAWLNNGSYDRVSVPLFLFDEKIDCMSRNGIMFILKKGNFQNIFNFFEMVRTTAKKTLDIIKYSVLIQNFEEFAQDCERHIWKLRKLQNIAAKPYLSKITMDHVKNVIQNNNLPVQVVEVGGAEMLVYDPRNKWVLLNLLDDNYLWSEMTELRYEVNGKRAM